MWIRSCQDMPGSPNQLLLNGKVLLPRSLSNGYNHHPDQISQHGFPFRILPSIADGYPIPILPNLNLLPEKTAGFGISDVMCSPSTPVPLDKNKRVQDRLSREVVDLVDGSETNGNTRRAEMGMLQPSAEEFRGLFSSVPVMSSQLVSEEVPLQQLETEKHGTRENQGIDLNRTPQKTRRKKHRPKVIKEGKSSRTPKPVTPKPVIPKPPRNKESPAGKRKYVRKKKVLDSSDSPLYPSWDIVDPKTGSGAKSVRRCLNFDSEEPQARDGHPGSSLMFARNAEVQARDACMSGTITSSSVRSAMSTVQGQEVMAENSPEEITLNFNSSTNQFPCEYIRTPETPIQPSQPSRREASPTNQFPCEYIRTQETPIRPSQSSRRETSSTNQFPCEYLRTLETPIQSSRRETMRMDHMLNGYIRVVKNPLQPPLPCRREIIHENLKEFARKNYIQIAGNSNISLHAGDKSQIDSNIASDVLLSGTKRHHNLVHQDHFSTQVNFSHAFNGIDRVSENHRTGRYGSYVPQIHKKRRADEQNEITSNSSSVTCSPSSRWEPSPVMPSKHQVLTSADAQRPMTSSWKTNRMVSNNCEAFTFADAQKIMAFEKLQASEHMLSFAQSNIQTNEIQKVPFRANNLTSLNATSGFNDMNCSQLSTLEKVSRCNTSQGDEIGRPQTYTETPVVKNYAKKKTKNCTDKEQIRLVKPKSSKTKRTPLQEHEAASCSYGFSQGQKSLQVIASASGNSKEKNTPCLPVSSLPDCQSDNNFKESLCDISLSGAIVPYGDPVDDIVRKLKRLNINGRHEIVRAEPENAIVPYGGGGGVVVPYEGPFDPRKKRRPRPKVDLDPETNRVWKLLMGKEVSDEETYMDKEKWWEEERRVFRGRVDSFIARMHLVQGDRRFSRWKGSVVDSVVGVFLTQNVSDHLSSSAYMALAARFPLRPKGNNSKPHVEKITEYTEPQDGCIISFDGSIGRKGSVLGQEFCPRDSFMIPVAEHITEKEISNSIERVGSNTNGSVVGYSEGIDLDMHKGGLQLGYGSPDSRTDTPVTVVESTSVAEAEDRRSTEDVASSQNSFVSSQNSSEYLVQPAEQIKLGQLSNFDAEDLVNGRMCSGLDSSTSFLELLKMAETTRFSELYSHDNGRISSTEYCSAVDQFAYSEAEKRTSVPDLREEYPSMYILNSHPHDIRHDFMGVPCAPPSSYNLQNSFKSSSTAMRDFNAVREESSSHVPSTVLGMNIIGRVLRDENSFQLPSTASAINTANNIKMVGGRSGPSAEHSTEAVGLHEFTGVSCAPSPSYRLQNFSNSRLSALEGVNAEREQSSSHLPSTASGGRCGLSEQNLTQVTGQQMPCTSRTDNVTSPSYHLNHSYSRMNRIERVLRDENSFQLPSTSSAMNITNNINMVSWGSGPSAEYPTEAVGQNEFTGASCAPSTSFRLHNFSNSRLSALGGANAEREQSSSHLPSTASVELSRTAPVLDKYARVSKHLVEPLACSETTDEQRVKFQQKERGVEFQVESTEHAVRAQAQPQSGGIHQTCSNSHNNLKEVVESNAKDEAYSSQNISVATANSISKAKKVKAEAEKKKTYEWDNLRKQACHNGAKSERSSDTMDSVDWEAVRCADVSEISQAIRERGMNNMLAERIKEFLNRIVNDHGSIDLEWLRDVPPEKAKDYLLSIRGLGLKSVECVRLLTLHHLAFPVDTNVGRISVRLGWVPLQPLPESLQLHLLEMYPVLETIQKYLWPRLCKLDQRTLYELHYQLITFGKVFCTKSKPNCNACPMRGECKHFASAFASARLALPGPEEKGLVSSTIPIASEARQNPVLNPMLMPRLEESTSSRLAVFNNCEPIIEEPATPEPEYIENSASAIEDAFYEDPDEIPTIKLNLEEFTQNLQNYMQENNMELQDGDMSKALVTITPEAASIPMQKLKNVSRLRTEHQVYELPDSHPLLEGLEQREPDDPSSYLLAIWSPGETALSTEPPTVCCNSQDTGKLCDMKTCFACNSIREAQAQTVRGTILIPCRTAMRGSFPLNGTYFQVNEVFADHDSSLNPIDVSREWLWNLPRRTVYFGTSIPTIFKGLTTEGIQHCFWRGLVCVRGFDRTTRAPRPLYARLHFPASKVIRSRKTAAAAAAATAAAGTAKAVTGARGEE